MELVADVLLIFGALAAALYCIVLSKRLQRLNSLEKGVGGAIAALSAQVDEMTKTLDGARQVANGSSSSLVDLTARAEEVARRLELLVASMHDLPTGDEDSSGDLLQELQDGGTSDGSDSSSFRTSRRLEKEVAA